MKDKTTYQENKKLPLNFSNFEIYLDFLEIHDL